MPEQYLPVLFQVIIAIGFAAVVLGASVVFGRSAKRNATKGSPYECGMLPVGDGAPRFSVKFYMVAMLFIVFDIETVFMIPWAAYYRQLSCAVPLVGGACPAGQISFFGLGEMLVFMAILFAGYVYIWKKGALQWD